MKVLLMEHPRSFSQERDNDIANAPLSACLNTGYIGGILKSNGISVAIIDGYLEGLDFTQIENKIAQDSPTILGVHLVYHWKDNQKLYAFLSNVKEKYRISYLCVYGYYPTFAYTEILNACPAIDACLLGEGELTFLNLAKYFPDFSPEGLAYRVGNEIKTHPGQVIKDLDALPFPLRHPASYSFGEINLSGSRGCYGNCTFCYINAFYGNNSPKWRGRSPENIIAEIDSLMNQTDIRYFYFTDPNFIGPGQAGRKRVLKLASLLHERHIQFGIEARVNDLDDEIVKALVDAGLKDILIGLESGRNESLKRLQKYTSVRENEAAIDLLRKYGIEPSVGFIMFEPDSSLSDLKENFNFLKRNHLLDHLETSVNVLYHHMIILQGSQSYHLLNAEGRLHISDHSTYEAHTDYLNPEVAEFAAIMRELTNYIFTFLKETWMLHSKGDPDMKQKYQAINDVLTSSFEILLTIFSTQTSQEAKQIYQQAKTAIEGIVKVAN
ncbi:radical SAM protein [Eubacteriaceae bacterium ES3]|nr:radical SAM protein [Eubacteriaceae bacterium ES3]